MEEQEFDNLEELMGEPPGGFNHGRHNGLSLDTKDHQQYELRFTGGFGIAHPFDGGTKGNGPNGRNVLAPGEYVDTTILRLEVEKRLGATYAEIAVLYGSKRLDDEQRERRSTIDTVMLKLQRAGANMYQFAEVVGMNQRTMNRALVRAREAA